MTIFDLIVEDTLNEISPQQAYENFYSSIPREDFDKIVNAFGKFNAFVKLLLKFVINNEISTEECLEIISNYKKLDNNSKIIITNNIKNNAYTNADDLIYDISHTEDIVGETRVGLVNNGYDIIGKTEHFIITVTSTYEANAKYFGHTSWCTASDRLGRYDGYEQFLNYTNNSALYQITSTTNDKIAFQIQIYRNGHFGTMCDIEDDSVDIDEIAAVITRYGDSPEKIFNLIIKTKDEYCEKTKQLKEIEKKYQESREQYYEEKRKRIEKRIRELNTKIINDNNRVSEYIFGKYDEFIKKEIYNNVDFINSLETSNYFFEKFFNIQGDEQEIFEQEYEDYAETHFYAKIQQEINITNNIYMMYIMLFSPFYYDLSRDNRIYKSPFMQPYTVRAGSSLGVLLIVEKINGKVTNIIRKIQEIKTGGLFNIIDYNQMLMFEEGTNAKLYFIKTGNIIPLLEKANLYELVKTKNANILVSPNEYLVISKNFNDVLKREVNSSRIYSNYGLLFLKDADAKFSTLYFYDDYINIPPMNFEEMPIGLKNYNLTEYGLFLNVVFKDYSIGLLCDEKSKKAYKIFDNKKYKSLPYGGDYVIGAYSNENGTVLAFDCAEKAYKLGNYIPVDTRFS